MSNIKYKYYSYKEADILLREKKEYLDFIQMIEYIEEEKLIQLYKEDNYVSLANSLKKYFTNNLKNCGWIIDKYIFKENDYINKRWSNNFCKDDLVINIAFDHNISISWNLLKGELDTRPNLIDKNGYSNIQVLITATRKFIKLSGFDAVVGHYDDYIEHLKPLSNILNAPILIIGLDELETFKIQKIRKNGKNIGQIISLI